MRGQPTGYNVIMAVDTQARLDALLERGEEQGCVNLSELSEIVRDLELDDDDAGGLHERLSELGVEVTDDCGRAGVTPTKVMPHDVSRSRPTPCSSSSTSSGATRC
jgi:hypothetical protein